MLLGAIGSGKTTFRQRLSNATPIYEKTQTVYAADGVLDTPGEYLEHGTFNRALLLTSYDADLVLMFQSATAAEAKLPPGFATFFPKPVLGIISKIDIASPADDRSAPGTSWLWPARANRRDQFAHRRGLRRPAAAPGPRRPGPPA